MTTANNETRTAQSTKSPGPARIAKLYTTALAEMTADFASRAAAKNAPAPYAHIAYGSASRSRNDSPVFPASLMIAGHALNPSKRPTAKLDSMPVFLDGAPCELSHIDAAKLARAVLCDVPADVIHDTAPFAGFAHSARGASTALVNTGISHLETCNLRARLAAPLLRHASGQSVPVSGALGRTSDAESINAQLIARANGIIAALENA